MLHSGKQNKNNEEGNKPLIENGHYQDEKRKWELQSMRKQRDLWQSDFGIKRVRTSFFLALF